MCKIIIVTNCSKINDMRAFSTFMCDLVQDQRDGFGYAALGDKGVFGVRTLNPSAYAKNPPRYVKSNAFSFGEMSKVVGGGIFHGRISTNSKSLKNTHPISRDGWHLIHNGVVTDHGPKYDMATTNDSEHVLKHLQTGGITAVQDNLTGYYAAGAIDKDGNLHVIRDGIANLFWTYSEKLGSEIFATTENILDEIGKEFGEHFDVYAVEEGTYLVFNKAGKLIKEETFKPRGYDTYSRGLSHLSLGRNLDDNGDGGEGFWSYWNRKPTGNVAPPPAPASTPVVVNVPVVEKKKETSATITDKTVEVKDIVTPEYIIEVDNMDNNYAIYDDKWNEIKLEDFRKLQLEAQVLCEIYRPDGTYMNPFEKSVNKTETH